MRSLPTRTSNTGLASSPTRPDRSRTPLSIMTEFAFTAMQLSPGAILLRRASTLTHPRWVMSRPGLAVAGSAAPRPVIAGHLARTHIRVMPGRLGFPTIEAVKPAVLEARDDP